MNFRSAVLRFRQFSGIDRPIAYTIAGKGLYAVASLVTVILLTHWLTKVEQGFFYTFASVLAVQVFFDLGLSYVVLQFTSHEKASLEWTKSGTLEGDGTARRRLASLLRLALKYYGVAALLVIAVVIPAGLYFFHTNAPDNVTVQWRFPWLWLGCATALSLFMSPLYSMIEGTGKVADIALMRTSQSLVTSLGLWLGLMAGGKLFAAPLSATMGLVLGVTWVTLRYRHLLVDLFEAYDPSQVIDWWSEVWPFQWKIALSWTSGYLIFQVFTPVLFAYQNAVVAGQMGMSLSVASGITTLALAWVSTKAAPFGSLVAKREFESLDRAFFSCLKQSLAALLMMNLAAWGAVTLLFSMHHPLGMRFLSPLPLGLLLLALTVNHVVAAMAVYIRAHKLELFVWVSLTIGCLTGLTAYLGARYSGVVTIMAGYLLVDLVFGLGWGAKLFMDMRRRRDQEGQPCN